MPNQVYARDTIAHDGKDFKGMMVTHRELRGGRHFYCDKLIVFRNLRLQKKGLSSAEEQEIDTII